MGNSWRHPPETCRMPTMGRRRDGGIRGESDWKSGGNLGNLGEFELQRETVLGADSGGGRGTSHLKIERKGWHTVGDTRLKLVGCRLRK